MVWFHCEDCGDTIKKPKLVNHYRNCSASRFSCVDCLQTFTRATVNTHTTCVTEHEKYALAATKPGGFAAGGLPSNREGGAAVGAPEPTGLEFLSTRPPWKCSVCNVNCTSRETLVNHSAGAKHKRRARAALAAANGGNTGNAANCGNGPATNGGDGSAAPGAAGATSIGATSGKRRPAPSSSSSSSSDDSSSSDSGAGKQQPAMKRQAVGEGAKPTAAVATVKGKPGKRNSSSSSDTSSDDISSNGSDSESDGPAAKPAERPPAPVSSSSSDDSDSDSDAAAKHAAIQKAGKPAPAAAVTPASVKLSKKAANMALGPVALAAPAAAQKEKSPTDSDSTSLSSSSEESSSSDDESDAVAGQARSQRQKTVASQGALGAITVATAKEEAAPKEGAGASKGKPGAGLSVHQEGGGGVKKLAKPQSPSSSSDNISESDTDSDDKPQARSQVQKPQGRAVPDSSSSDESDSNSSDSDSDGVAKRGKPAAGKCESTVVAATAAPVDIAAKGSSKGAKRSVPEPSSSSSSESESESDDTSSSEDEIARVKDAKVKSKKAKTGGLDAALHDNNKFDQLATAVKEALEKKAEVGRAVLRRLVNTHLLAGGDSEQVADEALNKVRHQLVAKRVCDLVNDTRLTKPKLVAEKTEKSRKSKSRKG